MTRTPAFFAPATLISRLLGVTTSTQAHAEGPERSEEEKLHISTIEELARRIEEEKLRGQYEQIVRDNEAKRQSPPDVPTGGIEQRRLLLPNILGVSASLGGFAPVGVGGFVGPLHIASDSTSVGLGRVSSQTVSFSPSADVIVGRRWTLGGTLRASRSTRRFSSESQAYSQLLDEQEDFQLGADPRVGFLVPLGNRVILWPQFSVSVSRGRSEARTMMKGPDASSQPPRISMSTGLGAQASATLLFPLSRYVYASLGADLGYHAQLVEEQDSANERFAFGTTGGIGLSF